jgi:hypothetical protein
MSIVITDFKTDTDVAVQNCKESIEITIALALVNEWLLSENVWVADKNGERIGSGVIGCAGGSLLMRFIKNHVEGNVNIANILISVGEWLASDETWCCTADGGLIVGAVINYKKGSLGTLLSKAVKGGYDV